MSDIRFNTWLHQSGTGGITQVDGGHVGIGTTNPDIAVHTANAKKVNVGIVTANSIFAGNFYGNGSNLTGIGDADKIIEGDTKVEVFDAGSQYISAEVNGSEKVRIDSAGRVMIGTTTEGNINADDLTIANSGEGGITIRSGSSSNGNIFFSDATSGAGEYAGIIDYKHSSNAMTFGTSGTERLRISSVGQTLINTSAVTNTHDYLTVKRPASGFGEMSMTVDANTSTGSAANAFIFTKSKHTYWNGYGFQSSHGHIGAIVGKRDSAGTSDQEIRIEIGGTHINQSEEKTWTFRNGGNFAVSDGNIELASGHGIDFSATGNISGTSSELLDDYEEGSWTPVVQGWDTFTPYSGSSYYQGWYVKVGGMVHCGWKIYIQHLTTPSSNAHVRIHGLPFTSRSVAAGPVAVMRFDIVETGVTNNQWNYMGGNSNTIYLYKQTNGGNGANAINASQNYSNMWTMGTATYATDS